MAANINLSGRPFEASGSRGHLALSGCLNRFTVLTPAMERAFKVAAQRHRVDVTAAEASIQEGGADMWIRIAQEYFKQCELHYLPSQLGMILRFNNEYQTLHPSSIFDEE